MQYPGMPKEKKMYEKGTVAEVANGQAKVILARTSACKNCGACIKAGPEEMPKWGIPWPSL